MAFFDESRQCGVGRGGVLCQRVFGRNGAKRHAHDGIGAGRENVHFAVVNQRAVCILNAMGKRETHAAGFTDPVFLHQTHPFRPAIQGGFFVADLNVVEQFLRVIGNFQVVTRNFAFFDGRARAPAFAVNYLFIRQHGLVHGVPIHHLGFAVGNAFFQHFQEQPLVPFVIRGVARGNFAAPINAQAQGLHLPFHGGDVVIRPLRGRHFVFQRGVFSGQAERIPAHRH